jgi:hypothetical protein
LVYYDSITIFVVLFLTDLGLSLAKISKITKVDVHRLKYLKKKEGLGKKADIEDQELDKWMHNTIQKFPNAGNTYCLCYIRLYC